MPALAHEHEVSKSEGYGLKIRGRRSGGKNDAVCAALTRGVHTRREIIDHAH